MMRRPPRSTPLPHHAALPISAALFARRGFEQTSVQAIADAVGLSKAGLLHHFPSKDALRAAVLAQVDRKSTRLNSSHANISYAVFCLKKKKIKHICCLVDDQF